MCILIAWSFSLVVLIPLAHWLNAKIRLTLVDLLTGALTTVHFGVISVRKDIIRLMQKFGLNCEEKLAFSLAKGHLKLPQL